VKKRRKQYTPEKKAAILRHEAAGRQREIHAERDQKLEEARKQRQIRRQEAA
jgi:hypothetical protein